MAVLGYGIMSQVLEWTGDRSLSEFHVTRRAVFEYCIVEEVDPTHFVSMVMLVTVGGVSSIYTPSDEADVLPPALLKAVTVM